MPTQAQKATRRAKRQATIAEAKKKGQKPYLKLSSPKTPPESQVGHPRTKNTEARRINERVKARAKRLDKTTCGDEGGITRDGQKCKQRAGKGTSHLGTGRCAAHALPSVVRKPRDPAHGSKRKMPRDTGHVVVDKQAPKNLNDAKQLLGIPIEMNAVDSLMWCIRLTAGEIQWYSDRMQELSQEQWIEDTFVGKQLHLYARNRTVSIDRLAKYSKWAMDGGIAERAMRLAEAYGEQLFQLLHGVLEDLDLSPHQRQLAPAVIRKHINLLDRRNVRNDNNVLTTGVEPETIVVEAIDA